MNRPYKFNPSAFIFSNKWRKNKTYNYYFSAENPPKIFNNQIIRYAGYDDMVTLQTRRDSSSTTLRMAR